MSVVSTTQSVKVRAENSPSLGSTIKFVFNDGEGCIYLDGSGDNNLVTNSDTEADCTVGVALEDFQRLLDGDLNPMSAFMTGKLKVEGSMGVAMKLQSLFN